MSFEVAAELFDGAGLHDVAGTILWVSLEHATFEAWWDPFTKRVGPAGTYLAGLSVERQGAIREACRARVTVEPFVVTGRAWAARGLS